MSKTGRKILTDVQDEKSVNKKETFLQKRTKANIKKRDKAWSNILNGLGLN